MPRRVQGCSLVSESWEEGQGILAVDAGAQVRGEVERVILLPHVADGGRRGEREVGAEEDLAQVRHGEQARERRGRRRQGDIEIEPVEPPHPLRHNAFAIQRKPGELPLRLVAQRRQQDAVRPDRMRLIAVRVVSRRKSAVNVGMPGTGSAGSSPGG